MADSAPDLEDSNDQQSFIIQLRGVDRDLGWNNELFKSCLLIDIAEVDPFNTHGGKRLLELWDECLALRNGSEHRINQETPSDRAVRMFIVWIQDVMDQEQEKDAFYAAAQALGNTALVHKFIAFMNETYSGFTRAQIKTLEDNTINACNNMLAPLEQSSLRNVHTMVVWSGNSIYLTRGVTESNYPDTSEA